MQTIQVHTTQNVSIHYPVASVGDRILAYLLDRVFQVVFSLAMVFFFFSIKTEQYWLLIALVGIPWVFYHLIFEIFMNGQTPGKRIMDIQVIRLDGTQATVGNYILRWIFSFIDFYILGGAIAVVIVAAGGKGQRLGDIVAGTSVIKLVKQQEITAEQIFVTAESTYQATFPQAAQMSPRDIELIQQSIEVYRFSGNEKPMILIAEKIKTQFAVQTSLHTLDFLNTILKDYSHFASRS